MPASLSSLDDGTTLLFRRSLSGNEGTEQPAISPTTSQTDNEAYGSFSRAVLLPSNPDDYALIEEGARFSRHQLAIYTVRAPFLFFIQLASLHREAKGEELMSKFPLFPPKHYFLGFSTPKVDVVLFRLSG